MIVSGLLTIGRAGTGLGETRLHLPLALAAARPPYGIQRPSARPTDQASAFYGDRVNARTSRRSVSPPLQSKPDCHVNDETSEYTETASDFAREPARC
jgi:hypothetical protein